MIVDEGIIRSRDEQRKSEHASRFRDACFKRADLGKELEEIFQIS